MESLQVKSLKNLYDLLSDEDKLTFLGSIKKTSIDIEKMLINVELEKVNSVVKIDIVNFSAIGSNVNDREDTRNNLFELIRNDKVIEDNIIDNQIVYDIIHQTLQYTSTAKFFACYEYDFDGDITQTILVVPFDPIKESAKLSNYYGCNNARYHYYNANLKWESFSFSSIVTHNIGPHDWIILDEDGDYIELDVHFS